MLRTARGIFSALLAAMLLPFLLLLGAGAVAVNSDRFLEANVIQNNIPQRSDFSSAEVMKAGSEIRSFFHSLSPEIELQLIHGSGEIRTLTQREVSHMSDVRRLIWCVYIALIVGFMLYGKIWWQHIIASPNTQVAICGLLRGMLTSALVGITGLVGGALLILMKFHALFVWLHQVIFPNDYWLLAPTDLLALLYPESFWIYTAQWIVSIAAIALVIIAIAVVSTLAGIRLAQRYWRTRQILTLPHG